MMRVTSPRTAIAPITGIAAETAMPSTGVRWRGCSHANARGSAPSSAMP